MEEDLYELVKILQKDLDLMGNEKFKDMEDSLSTFLNKCKKNPLITYIALVSIQSINPVTKESYKVIKDMSDFLSNLEYNYTLCRFQFHISRDTKLLELVELHRLTISVKSYILMKYGNSMDDASQLDDLFKSLIPPEFYETLRGFTDSYILM